MNQQGRDLSSEVHGDDVRLLQSELHQFGVSVEDEERFFSKASHRAVLNFQRRNALEGPDEF